MGVNPKVLHAVIVTSLFWVAVDVVLLSFCGTWQDNTAVRAFRDAQGRPLKPRDDPVYPDDAAAGHRRRGPPRGQVYPDSPAESIQNVPPVKGGQPEVDKQKDAWPKIPQVNQKWKEIRNEDIKWMPPLNYDVTSMPRDPNGPGEHGKGVTTKPEEEPQVKAGWKLASFNKYVSDKISYERSIPDTRLPECKTKKYPEYLPPTSVIMCFTDEAFSAVMRSVHSIINRTPPHLLAEVILVDDNSTRAELKGHLDDYVRRQVEWDKVKVVHLEKREGLIRCRLRGAEKAVGPVLTFLDAHIECNVGWVEPLLHRIWENRSNVVMPIIEAIDDKTFEYHGGVQSSRYAQRGGFSWELHFDWRVIPEYEIKRWKGDETTPIRSPTMAGGLFSIDKSYFYELGTYDDKMDTWGGENLELSFKIWMCGGTLEQPPCSKVGHVFRSSAPYSNPSGPKTFIRNTLRVVEVWLDSYKDLFYALNPHMQGEPYGDVSERKRIRERLQCKSFDWFLENIFPELPIPDKNVQGRGELKNLGGNKCMDTMGEHAPYTGLYSCHGMGGNQVFSYTWKNVISYQERCLAVSRNKPDRISLYPCGDRDILKWKHEKGGTFSVVGDGRCLDYDYAESLLSLRNCNEGMNQRWMFNNYYDDRGNKI
ncbi:polypeptide N-acetylgalactosaminyltransferase 13-like [Branchiostoma floridae]|uniref:Polypeptide N-acetylgalactosaminyltransferase n=1 Tax=Branchiostoma floridae TaxID=7739 RepID=A0A9J7M3M3_BRAFL|nr:polypeptide N-acetylgalactosaminyltransferase 13-like [Branchiostoma floridae]